MSTSETQKKPQITEENTTGQDKSGEKKIVVFDFRMPHRLSKNQIRTLHVIHQNFGDAFGAFLVGRLQMPVSVKVKSVDQVFYSEYISSVAVPSSLFLFRIKQSEASAIINMSPDFIIAVVARLLGGMIDPEQKPRPITKIEQNIVQGVIEKALENLQESWKIVSNLKFDYERYEPEAEFAQIAPASEIVLVVSYDVTINDTIYPLNLCLPTFALDDILAKMEAQRISGMRPSGKTGKTKYDIIGNLEETKIEAQGILGDTSITLKEFLNLEEGDIITTKIPLDNEMTLVVGGKTKILGKPGVSEGSYAMKITKLD